MEFGLCCARNVGWTPPLAGRWRICCYLRSESPFRPSWMSTDMDSTQLINKRKTPPVPSDVILTKDADDFRAKCFAIEPDDRPSASELRQHPYLELPPNWTFTGFKWNLGWNHFPREQLHYTITDTFYGYFLMQTLTLDSFLFLIPVDMFFLVIFKLASYTPCMFTSLSHACFSSLQNLPLSMALKPTCM